MSATQIFVASSSDTAGVTLLQADIPTPLTMPASLKHTVTGTAAGGCICARLTQTDSTSLSKQKVIEGTDASHTLRHLSSPAEIATASSNGLQDTQLTAFVCPVSVCTT